MSVARKADGPAGMAEMIEVTGGDEEEARRVAIEARMDAKEMEILNDGHS